MTGLSQVNNSYMILSSTKLDDIVSVLYAKDYQIIPIKEYYKGVYGDSIISFGRVDNDNLRNDVIFLLNHFHEDFAIIKYFGETVVKKILKDGSEITLDLNIYNTNDENVSYICDGISFSFEEATRYWKPTKKEDFKIGMVVEYCNNNKWYQKKVDNPTEEYEKLYKLLIKHDKIRVASK